MMSKRGAFRMPTPVKISGRSSSLTAAFVSAIIPQIEPTAEEIKKALQILGMDVDDVRCAYCGAAMTEWDHLRPLVADQKPTGFISEIRNLVPSCSKCNQSKGNKYWKDWITSSARLSPKTRKVPDLDDKISRLEAYEKWGAVKRLDLQSPVDKEVWEEHWANWRFVLRALKVAQAHAQSVRKIIEGKVTPVLEKPTCRPPERRPKSETKTARKGRHRRRFPKEGTIGHIVLTALAENPSVTSEELGKVILAKFPNSRWGPSHLAWYRHQLKKGNYPPAP